MNLSDLQRKRLEIQHLAQKYGIQHVRVFGSIARGEASPHSDIDLLVELEPGRSLMDAGGFQYDLQELLGRKVDVVASRGENRTAFVREMEKSAVDIL